MEVLNFQSPCKKRKINLLIPKLNEMNMFQIEKSNQVSNVLNIFH